MDQDGLFDDEFDSAWPATPKRPTPVKLSKQFLFTWEDGSQVLVDVWSSGLPTASRRERIGDVWGVPADGVVT